MSNNSKTISDRNNRTFWRRFFTVLVLLLTGGLIANLPISTTVVRAAASFLSTVAHNTSLTGDGTSTAPLGIANNGVGTNLIANGAVTAPKIADGQVVKNINGLNDGVTLAAGSNVSLALTGQTLTISSLLGLTSVNHDATLAGNGTSLSPLGIPDAAITNEHIRSGEVLRELNNLRDSVTLVGGSNVTITPTGNNTLTIASNPPPSRYIHPLRVATLQWYEANQTRINFDLGQAAHGIAFDGTNIWVTHGGSGGPGGLGSLTKLRASDGAILGTFSVANARGIAFDGANMWVTNYNPGTVTKLRASDGAILGTFSVGNEPDSLAFDGTNIWVTNSGSNSNSVMKLRASDGAILGTFVVATGPRGIAFDGANIWVTSAINNSNTVTKLRASDGVILGTFGVTHPHGIAFDGANIWVTSSSTNTVRKLRASDGVNLGTFATGSSPFGIAFDGANIWVGNNTSNTVTKFRASDGVNLGTFVVGSDPSWSGPWGIAFDGANIWVTNTQDFNVTKL